MNVTIVALLIAPLLFSKPLAAETPSPLPAKQTNRPIPFHGMVSGIDQKNRTFTITGKGASRVFKVTDKTVILKGAGAANFSDIAENEEVSGAYWNTGGGSFEAKMIKLGPTEKKAGTPAAKPSPTAKSVN
jgi:hypothetical protein